MECEISEKKFRDIAELVADIARYSDHDIVKRYHDTKEEYSENHHQIKNTWEKFLSVQIRHTCARVGFQEVLDREFGIDTVVRGLDTEVDWVTFVHPWGVRIGLQSDSINKTILVRSILQNHSWVTLTEKQYNKLSPGTIILAGQVSYDNDEGFKLKHPDPFETSSQHAFEKPGELRRQFRDCEDYGKYTIDKYVEGIDWIVSNNSPVKIDVLGSINKDSLENYRNEERDTPTIIEETMSVEEFITEGERGRRPPADYAIPVDELEDLNDGVPF